jgi:subtilisin family serine protease
MYISHYSPGKRISLSLGLALSLGLLLIAILIFPSASRAKLEPSQVKKSSKKERRPAFRPGEVIVRYKNESMAKLRTGAMRLTARSGELLTMQVERVKGSELIPGLRLARTNATDTLKVVAALREQADVLYAEPNYIMKADVTPNDTHFAANQSNMTMIGAPQAWDTKTGSTGNDRIVVAVVDQGIDINHLDLQPNIWTNPMPGSVMSISGDVNGYNFVDDNGTVFSGSDSETHATHVAGIIGAVGNNGKGVTGVNWSVGLMSLKFLDPDGFGDTMDAIDACTYARDMRNLWDSSGHTKGANIRVLNASFGGAAFSTAFLNAITDLNNAGILLVAAAGNTGDDGTHEPDNDRVPHYPSSFNVPNVIAVASVNQSDAFSSNFSHFGATTVDLAAPGDPVLSTTPHCAKPGPQEACNPTFSDGNGDTYTFFAGTSMSVPHVSGAAALLWAQNPNLTVAQVKSLLLGNGDVRPTLVDKTLTGRRLNIAQSFQALFENDTTAPGPVTNLHINSQFGRTVNLGWTASGDDGANGRAALYQLNFIDGVSGAVIPLKGLEPMPSGSGQIASVIIPYRHTTGTLSLLEFDNVGNAGTPVNIPIGILPSQGDPYTSSVGAAAALSSGGQRIDLPSLNADDGFQENFLLPFSFPFFGQNFTDVTISTNGALYFGDPPPRRNDDSADDVPSSPGKLGAYGTIAGLWDDLDLRTSTRADAGVFQVVSSNQVIFRFQGKPCNFDSDAGVCLGGADINFEIELNSNGVIKLRYGSGNTQLFPTVGIGGGGPDGYTIASHTSEETPINLTNAGEVTFTPRAQTVSTIAVSQSTFDANESTGSVVVTVNRSGDRTSVATVDYVTSDGAGSAGCNDIGSNASSRCDYLTSVGSLKFAAGETSKTVAIPIVNDIYTENAETFSFTLTNNSVKGATLGTPATATITINDGGAEGTSNPIDDAEFFVRQHYVDFLNREPDPVGFNFWKNEILGCGANAQCIEVKRINVSAAFFVAIEFQETGYLVYRIYKTALGTPPGAPVPITFKDFIRDTQRIGLGVQVNVGDWKNILEFNKQAFTLDFVQSQKFMDTYSPTMTATQIVDQMNANAGNVLTPTERDDLINSFGTTPGDLSKRAAVLRSISENAVLKAAELNKAFVLMQYFGYLRRSSNDPPDSDFNGFNFWLGKLNDFNGNYITAEMVKAFITSIEYRRRFAP